VLDLAVGCDESAELAVLRGLGNGDFAPQVLYPTGGATTAVAHGYFDDDRRLDLAVANFEGTVRTFINQGDGTFAVGRDLALGTWLTSLAAADVDRDDRSDLLTSGFLRDEIWMARGVGGGDFANPERFAADTGSGLAVADVTGDGMADLIALGGGELRVLPQTGIPLHP
jgi:hypothetical protein